MSIIMTGDEFAKRALNIANNYKTLYVMGCYGSPLNEKNKEKYTTNHKYNTAQDRVDMITRATKNTFGFDCSGLVKAILWGWNGDESDDKGGARVGSNGVPNIASATMIKHCTEVSEDFSDMKVGELLWMPGHVGIYIGDGKCVEATPSWKNCVQVTAAVKNAAKNGPQKWQKHGKLEWVSYESTFKPYNVRVGIKFLNVRTGPGVDFVATGDFSGVGEFTIIEEAYGSGASKWGRLKNGKGWISLDYATRV